MGHKTKDSTAFTDAVRSATTSIALKRDFTTSLKIKSVNLTKTILRGQRAAFCEIDETNAIKALDKARIKIGWINCRIWPVVRITRCYRCLGYGHPTRTCKGQDRSKFCYKCGGVSHKSVDCAEQPKCFLCTSDKDAKNSLPHMSGSGVCKVFRAALAEATILQKRCAYFKKISTGVC
ncbi:unnamed protein product [Euphydryas editha]|uniref:CCHC-type domain-containing protein n=1 Tax=Euphydryas editha TaxID=104508 RepID=A0AAU9VEJ5_EUPED|nr:unnamed protein product [Euphydryas editha]